MVVVGKNLGALASLATNSTVRLVQCFEVPFGQHYWRR